MVLIVKKKQHNTDDSHTSAGSQLTLGQPYILRLDRDKYCCYYQ